MLGVLLLLSCMLLLLLGVDLIESVYYLDPSVGIHPSSCLALSKSIAIFVALNCIHVYAQRSVYKNRNRGYRTCNNMPSHVLILSLSTPFTPLHAAPLHPSLPNPSTKRQLMFPLSLLRRRLAQHEYLLIESVTQSYRGLDRLGGILVRRRGGYGHRCGYGYW